MADTSLNIGVSTSANLGGLNQTVAAINQVTAAQQRQAAAQARAAAQRQQGAGVADQFSGAVMGGLGIPTTVGAAVSALLGFARVLTSTAGHVKDFSEQLNISTDEFQKLERAASETGVPLNRLIGSLGLLEQQRKAAAEGNGALRAAFSAVGISLDDLNNESIRAIDLQGRLAAATTNMTDQQRAAVRVLLGAQGARLLPALQAMQAIKDADVASPEAIANVDEFGKTWERVWMGIKKAGIETLADLNTGLQDFMLTLAGARSPDTRPSLRADEQEFKDQTALGVAPAEMRGGAKRFRDFEQFGKRQEEAANEADRAMRQAGQAAASAEADAGELELDGGTAEAVAAAKARGAALRAEEKRQLDLRTAARKAAGVGYAEFSQQRGDGKRFEVFEKFTTEQRKTERTADTAMQKAGTEAASAEEQAALLKRTGGTAAAVAEAKARGEALRAEEQRQRELRDAARKAAETSEAQFRQTGPSAPLAPTPSEPMFVDNAAAKAAAELDKQRVENAEKRRKLEFDMLTPAQKRADIEKRIAENKFQQADEFGLLSDMERAKLEGQGVDLEAELAAANREEAGQAKAPEQVNQWERIGASFGGRDEQMAEVVQVQRETKAAVDRVGVQLFTIAGFGVVGIPVTIKD